MTVAACRFGWTPAETRRCRLGELAHLFTVAVDDRGWAVTSTQQDLTKLYERKVAR